MNVKGILLLFLIWSGGCPAAEEEVVWFDGSRAPSRPAGKLLSDNSGYWGECVLTGVDYTYETSVTNPPDIYHNDAGLFGRRLLDGITGGNWWVPVGRGGGPVTVVFDFKRTCRFTELDVCSQSGKIAIKIETRNDKSDPWRVWAVQAKEKSAEGQLHRMQLADRPSGRYLRLTVDSGGVTFLNEVLAWGYAEAKDKTPEYLKPTVPFPVANGCTLESIPGKSPTAVADWVFLDWRKKLSPAIRALPAVWSQLPTWGDWSSRPIVPEISQIHAPIEMLMARNETECAAVALTNTSINAPCRVEVSLSPVVRENGQEESPAITGDLRVGGMIASRWYGNNIGPLFSADNLLGHSLMQKYLTNGASIMDFPKVALSPAGSAVLWISITTKGARPGNYETRLNCTGGKSLPIRIRVVEVTLPEPFHWLETWSTVTGMFPFEDAGRKEREVAYKQSLGINVWYGFPTPGSLSALARGNGKALYHEDGLGKYRDVLYNSGMQAEQVDAKTEKEIGDLIKDKAATAVRLGLTYDEWFVELADEPGNRNASLFAAFCRIIRKTDPKVNIYCNPCFWVGGEDGVASESQIEDALSGWYDERVDLSVPLYQLMAYRPKAFKAYFDPVRWVRAFYCVASHHAKSERPELVQHYRRMAWEAMSRGWNGWGFYSYFAPRGNPWDDFDEDFFNGENMPDYQVVYPGPHGPVPSRPSEAVREGWEDYRLMSRLGDQERQAILSEFRKGESMESLRRRALKFLEGKSLRNTERAGHPG